MCLLLSFSKKKRKLFFPRLITDQIIDSLRTSKKKLFEEKFSSFIKPKCLRSLAYLVGLRVSSVNFQRLGEMRKERQLARSRMRRKIRRKGRRVIKLISISVEEKLSAHFERLEELELRGKNKIKFIYCHNADEVSFS